MEPAEFRHHFAVYRPVTGATVFPFDLASTVLLTITTYSAVKTAGRGCDQAARPHGNRPAAPRPATDTGATETSNGCGGAEGRTTNQKSPRHNTINLAQVRRETSFAIAQQCNGIVHPVPVTN